MAWWLETANNGRIDHGEPSLVPSPPPPPGKGLGSLRARPLKNWKGGSGKRGGVEVYTVEC